MDMTIYFMHYNTMKEARSRDPNKARPAWFSYNLCFQNLLDTIAGHADWNVELVIWFDGTTEEAHAFIAAGRFRFPPGVSLILVASEFGSQRASSDAMLPHILGQNYSDDRFIYILENDYLHRPDWLVHLKNLVDAKIHFTNITLYDHKDNYIHNNYNTQIFDGGSHLWRSTLYSCWSQICRYGILKYEIRNLMKYNDRAYFADNAARGGRLLAPMPGLATHSMAGLLSPTVDWDQIAASHRGIAPDLGQLDQQ